MQRLITIVTMLMFIAWAAVPARARISVDYSAGEYLATQLANDGYPSNNDILSLSGSSGKLDLSVGGAVTARLAVFDFTSGYSSYEVVTQFFNTGQTNPWTLTLDGVTQTLSIPYSVTSGYTTDTLIMNDGPILSFPVSGSNEMVTVQALGFTSNALLNTTEGVLFGRFTVEPAARNDTSLPTPEPSTLVLCGTAGSAGALVVAWRRRRLDRPTRGM
jgi:hypothetical protein